MVEKKKYDIKKTLEKVAVGLVIFGVTLESMGHNWTALFTGSIFMGLWNAAKFYVKEKGLLK